jgi:TPR repeat protein
MQYSLFSQTFPLSGEWTGTLTQGKKTFEMTLNITVENGNIKGTSRIQYKSYYVLMDLEGSVLDGALKFEEKKRISQKKYGGNEWCFKKGTLKYSLSKNEKLKGKFTAGYTYRTWPSHTMSYQIDKWKECDDGKIILTKKGNPSEIFTTQGVYRSYINEVSSTGSGINKEYVALDVDITRFRGNIGLKGDLKNKEFKELKKKSKKGDLSATNLLGLAYLKGVLVKEINLIKATELLKKAADGGNELAQFNLAVLYKQLGWEMDVNPLIIKYMTKASDQGLEDATWFLAVAYINGFYGQEKKLSKAVKLLKGISSNNAKTELGKIFLSKKSHDAGVPVSLEIGKKYLIESGKPELFDKYMKRFNHFGALRHGLSEMPSLLKNVNVNIDYTDEIQIKGLIDELSNSKELLGLSRIDNYIFSILDQMAVIKSPLNEKYEKTKYDEANLKNTPKAYTAFSQKFPNSDYSKEAALKISQFEEQLFSKVSSTNTIESYQQYLEKYPGGKYSQHAETGIADIQEQKRLAKEQAEKEKRMAQQKKEKETLRKEQEKEAKFAAYANKYEWKLGDRICSKSFEAGIIEGVLDQWNDDKSKAKLKIVGSPGGNYKGEDLTKGNMIWVDPVEWYKCMGDESVNYDIASSGGGNTSISTTQQQGSKSDVRKYAIGFGKQMMYKCHVEDSPRNLDIDITKWEYFTKEDGYSFNGYMVRMKIWWIENIPIFATKRTVDGCMIVDEFGCSPIFFVFSEDIPSLFGGCFSKAGSGKGMRDEIVEFCDGKDSSKYYAGKCIDD